MRSSLFLALSWRSRVALPRLPVTAHRDRDRDRDRDREREESQDAQSRIDTTFAFSRPASSTSPQISGDVVVNAWDRSEARVRAYAERGRIRSSLSSSRLSLEIESVRGRIGRLEASRCGFRSAFASSRAARPAT